jgi:hypothetical protein
VEPAKPEALPFMFGSDATARLEVYKMAVRVGFYTEWPDLRPAWRAQREWEVFGDPPPADEVRS